MNDGRLVINFCDIFSQAHERVHRMNENPVMFILTCLQKLHFKKDFYPIIDVMELHKILTMPKEDLLAEITPELRGNKNTQNKKEQVPRSYNLTGDNYQKRMQMKRYGNLASILFEN